LNITYQYGNKHFVDAKHNYHVTIHHIPNRKKYKQIMHFKWIYSYGSCLQTYVYCTMQILLKKPKKWCYRYN